MDWVIASNWGEKIAAMENTGTAKKKRRRVMLWG